MNQFLYTSRYNPNIYSASNNPAIGQVQFVNNTLCVYDGYNWQSMPQFITEVHMTSMADDAINWAYKKMLEEQQLAELAKSNHAVHNALLALNDAKSKLNVIVALSKDTNEVDIIDRYSK